MNILYKHVLSATIVVMLFLAAGCNQKAGNAVARYGFVDSIQVDSMTLWQNPNPSEEKFFNCFVMDSLTPVYIKRGDHLYLDTTLKMGDPVTVLTNTDNWYFDGKFYRVGFNGKVGYVKGTTMGYGVESDFDNDGKMDLVIYGYSRFELDSFAEIPANPVTVKFVSATGAVSEVTDTASSNLELTEVANVKLSSKVHVYELNAGYPACGYPQFHFIIAYGNGKASIIHRSVTSVDSGMGDYCQFYYPSDTTHHIDTIYISHRLSVPISEGNDSLMTTTADSTILYLHEGSWGEKNYKMDPKSN